MRKSRFQAKLKAARLLFDLSRRMESVYEKERYTFVDDPTFSGTDMLRLLVAVPDKSPLWMKKRKRIKKFHQVLSLWVAYTSRGTVSSNEKE